ncbi:PIN domain-like protein [Fennellomyces sp. T-0311]|nr:PIN domain-like protein [Fennellomyces sp. T-0311]
MGVHSLTTLLRRYAPGSLRTIDAKMLSQQTIAFDASCHLNKFVYGEESHPHRHIYGFYLMVRFCDRHNIVPIFVFDGAHRIPAKELEHARRERNRRKIRPSLEYERERTERLASWTSTYRNLSDPAAAARALSQLQPNLDSLSNVQPDSEENQLVQLAADLRQALIVAEDSEKYTRTVRGLSAREHALMTSIARDGVKDTEQALDALRRDNYHMVDSLEKRSIRITHALRKECFDFLRTLGYACIMVDNHEAEAMCSQLAKQQLTTATVTEDLDALVFGDAPILRYFFARNRPILEVNPIVARNELGLTRDQFVDMCILCGTDFSGTIRGIGPVRALESIRRYGSIEDLLRNLDKRYVPSEHFNYELARQTLAQ